MMIKNKTDSCVLFSYLPLNTSASLWCLSRVYTPQLTPTEVLPLWKHRPLCMWNQRVQHSSIQRMNNEPDSCRNNPLSPTGRVQSYPRFQGSCLPQGGQSESLWCQQAEQPADPQSCCPSAPVQLHSCENRGFSWMNRSPSLLDHQSANMTKHSIILLFKLDLLTWMEYHQLIRTAEIITREVGNL